VDRDENGQMDVWHYCVEIEACFHSYNDDDDDRVPSKGLR